MKFKGTKGDWKVINAEDGVFIFSNSNLLAEIEEYNNETLFNALLISKAPEMLNLLKELYPILMDRLLFESGNKVIKLIKESTEL